MDSKIEELRKIAEKYDIGLSHFLVETEIKQNSIENFGRFSLSKIPKGKDIAIIGGLIVEEKDGMIAMPIGAGLYLNQIHMLYRASINHSCLLRGHLWLCPCFSRLCSSCSMYKLSNWVGVRDTFLIFNN